MRRGLAYKGRASLPPACPAPVTSSAKKPPRAAATLLTACVAAALAEACWRSTRATRPAGRESHKPSDAIMRRAPVTGRRTCKGGRV
jgi:hypothetical protein